MPKKPSSLKTVTVQNQAALSTYSKIIMNADDKEDIKENIMDFLLGNKNV